MCLSSYTRAVRVGSRLVAAVVAAGVGAALGTGPADARAAAVSAKVRDQKLVVSSLKGNSRITLRLRPGHRLQLAVDADSDGDTDFLFSRTRFRAIVVNGRGGNDVVRLDESRGVFTTGERTTIVGGPGKDTLRVDGSGASESFDLSASGPRLRLRRGAAAIVLEAGSVETIDLRTGGGADAVAENALAGTPVASVRVDLGPGDHKADRVTVSGTEGNDTATVTTSAGVARASGLSAPLVVTQRGTGDTLTLNGLGGDDTVTASGLAGRVVVEGGPGSDTLRVRGSAAHESFALSANGARVRLVKGVAPVMDANGVEQVDVLPLGGSDTLTVGDLSGTAVTSLDVDLGPADGNFDQVTLSGTTGDDVAIVAGDATGVLVFGLAAQVSVSNSAVTDVLRVNALAGDDVIDASSLSAGAISLTLDGGDGGDVLIGSAGPDTSSAAPGTTSSSAAPAWTSSTAGPATTSSSRTRRSLRPPCARAADRFGAGSRGARRGCGRR